MTVEYVEVEVPTEVLEELLIDAVTTFIKKHKD